MTDCYGPGCRFELPDDGPPWFHSEVCQRQWLEATNRTVLLPVPPPARELTVGGVSLTSSPWVVNPTRVDLPVEIDPDSAALPLPPAVDCDTVRRVCEAVTPAAEGPVPVSVTMHGVTTQTTTASVDEAVAWAPAEVERRWASPGWLGRVLHRLFGRTT
jgi:hypothetical protein